MKNLRKISPYIFIILWILLIFYLSHQPRTQSNELSKGITKKMIRAVEKIDPKIELDLRRLNHIIRKNAHFFAYLILGILVSKGLKSCGINGFKRICLALLICILFAISDEVHQLFVPGRGGQVKDVIIDSTGATLGIAIYSLTTNSKDNT